MSLTINVTLKLYLKSLSSVVYPICCLEYNFILLIGMFIYYTCTAVWYGHHQYYYYYYYYYYCKQMLIYNSILVYQPFDQCKLKLICNSIWFTFHFVHSVSSWSQISPIDLNHKRYFPLDVLLCSPPSRDCALENETVITVAKRLFLFYIKETLSSVSSIEFIWQNWRFI